MEEKLNIEEIKSLLTEMESDRIERTVSLTNTDKFAEAICAFSNDFPNHRKPGYLIIGVDDKTGKPSGITVTDDLLKNLSAIRSSGNILPQPAMTVEKYSFEGGDVAVVKVIPAYQSPVRYKGRIWIRTGPSKAVANEVEERILIEKRTSNAKTFDASPFIGTTINDINLNIFKEKYLPNAIDKETFEKNGRDIKLQLASLRLYDIKYDCPTNAGILVLSDDPMYFLPGAYIQYVKFDGIDVSSSISNEKRFVGSLVNVISQVDEFIKNNLVRNKLLPTEGFFMAGKENYPHFALRELLMNAIMHRDYESNTPIKLYEFSNRIIIQNTGALYGAANKENFPNVNDYRNPIIGEALKNLGFVEKFSVGISRAKAKLLENNNPEPKFDLSLVSAFEVEIFSV